MALAGAIVPYRLVQRALRRAHDRSRPRARKPHRLIPRQAAPRKPKRARTIFVSDVHLGARGAKAHRLADFLRVHDCDTLYLVGDIIDGWRLQRSWYWHGSHDEVVDEILAKAKNGTRVVYLHGNHDIALSHYVKEHFTGVEVLEEAEHVTADGRRLLVVHGDQFDAIGKYSRWIDRFGNLIYGPAMRVTDVFVAARNRLNLPDWSLEALKRRLKNRKYVANYEKAVIRGTRKRKFDGVVCGHIHHAAMKKSSGFLYCNTGDWMDSCTALVEDETGVLSIVRWDRARTRTESHARAAA